MEWNPVLLLEGTIDLSTNRDKSQFMFHDKNIAGGYILEDSISVNFYKSQS